MTNGGLRAPLPLPYLISLFYPVQVVNALKYQNFTLKPYDDDFDIETYYPL